MSCISYIHIQLTPTFVDDLLVRRAIEAVQQRAEQVEACLVFADALPARSVAEWTEMVKAWEAQPSKPNPFEPSKSGAYAGVWNTARFAP